MSDSPEKTGGLCEVCQKITTRKCPICDLMFYCSLEHQQSHWTIHKTFCHAYDVNYSDFLGRYLRATRELQYGDVILTENPLVFGPKTELIQEGAFPCVGCCKLLNDQNCEKCPECLWPACRVDCEGLKLPNYHGFECTLLKLGPKRKAKPFFEYYRFDILIILRALYLQKHDANKWKLLLDLEDHSKYRGPESETYKVIQEKVNFLVDNYLKPLRKYERANKQVLIPDASINTIHSLYGILDVNAIELSEDMEALVLYYKASLLEHNCAPNTMQIIEENDNFKITLRAASKIREDDHITSIYTNILWGTRNRREHLRRTKYFNCNCERCRDPTEYGTMLSGMQCMGGTEDEPCGGTQLPQQPNKMNCVWRCDRCSIELPDEEVMKFVSHLKDEVGKELANKPTLEELENTLSKLSIFLHPNHYLIYKVKHALVQVVQLLNEKVKMSEELITITRTIDPGNSRLGIYMGVLLNEQFKAKFKMLSNSFEEERKDAFMELINQISNLLGENKKLIHYRRNTQAGSRLCEAVSQNELKFNNWINEHSVKCG